MLFALARLGAERPEEVRATGPELAAALAELLDDPETRRSDRTWHQARQLVTMAGPPGTGPTPTAATVAEAIEEVLHGHHLELPASAERYEEQELLGIGGMGRVYRVRDRRLGRSVALKALHSGVSGLATARRFALEAALTARLEHPNIVPLYDLGEAPEGGLYLTMKEVRGRSLGDAIDDASHAVRTEGADPTREILGLVRAFRQVCDGVAFAHQQRIAHRDLKPDNIMVGDFGEVRVMDWGLALELGTPVDAVAGTPQYMAPEVAWDRVETVGPAPDVYALGATLYHLLCFAPPYVGEAPAVLEQIRLGPPVRPAERSAHPIPEELEAVVLRAMARDPAERYPSVALLAEDIQAWLDGRPLSTLSYGPAALMAKWARRNRPLVVAVGATSAVAVALGSAGALRYVLDVTVARDAARAQEERAVEERDRARGAETLARERMVEAELAAARASTETGRYGRADELYRQAAAELADLGQPALGAAFGRLDNRSRAERPLFEIPLPSGPSSLEVDAVHGWLARLTPGELVVMRQPPRFDARWTSAVPVPDCLDRATRWEGDTLALYCADAEGVRRFDMGSGEVERIAAALGEPPVVDVPAGTDLVFAGVGSRTDWAREPVLHWFPITRGPDGWERGGRLDITEVSSARGPWFLGERYARDHGTALYHVDRGRVRTIGMPLARGGFSNDGRWVATYHEGTHELQVEPLEGGRTLWTLDLPVPLVVRAFSPDDRTLFAAGSTTMTIHELSAADGARIQAYDGHAEPVQEVHVTDALVTSTGLDQKLLGYSRTRPSDRVDGSALGVLPPGDVLVLATAPRELAFMDLPTRKVLRRVDLSWLDPDESWEAESVQADGALLVTAQRIAFVPLAEGPVVPLVTSDGRPLRAGDHTPDGHLAFCRGSDVVLRTPDGEEQTLGRIAREQCRDLAITGPDHVFVSDFWGHAVHRFASGHPGPVWTRSLERTVYRLSVEAGMVSVGGWGGQVQVYDAQTGEIRMAQEPIEGPALGTALAPGAGWVAAAGWDQRVVVLDRASGRILAEDQRHDAPVEWLAWSEDGRRLVSADPGTVILRDLDLPARLDAGRRAVSELASDPDRDRTGAEWAEIARGLAVHGLWTDALATAPEATGLSALELARWHWWAGDPEVAADQFAQARRQELADPTYLGLCEKAARREAGGPTY